MSRTISHSKHISKPQCYSLLLRVTFNTASVTELSSINVDCSSAVKTLNCVQENRTLASDFFALALHVEILLHSTWLLTVVC